MSNLKKNIGYQTVYQILITCLPLITSPYLSRILGPENLGVFSYTQSIVNYFTLFAMLGLANYGTRSIAEVSSNKEKRSKVFLSIFTLQFLTCSISIIVYIIYLIFFKPDYLLISIIQAIAIISCFLDINWLFFGLEKFKLTVSRNIFIKISTVIFILLFVKTEKDLWVYVLLMVGSTLLSQFVLWLYVPKLIKVVKFTAEDVLKHIKPNIMLFIPLAAMSVYHIMDKTMLGMFSSFEQTGFYYNADKVINIPAGIISGISTVMMPRISALIGDNEEDKANELFNKTLMGTVCIASALSFGIASISNEFIPVFFGDGYEQCVFLVKILSPVLIIKGFSFTFRYLYLIPRGMEKKYIYSIVSGMVVNLIINFMLIPKYGAIGAVFGTLMAELIACIVQYLSIYKEIKIGKIIMQSFVFLILGIVMYLAVRIVSNILHLNYFIEIIVGMITGASVYLGFCYILYKIYLKKIYI